MENRTYMPDESDWERLLVGHKIVEVVEDGIDATLTLEDGTRFKVEGNEGCGGCSAGYYYVSQIATVDNIITAVRTDVEPKATFAADVWYEEAYTYRVFVMTTNREIEMLTVDGDDGNGYYGSGYYLTILEG